MPVRLLLLTDGGLRHASSRTRALGYAPLLGAAGYAVAWRPRRADDAPLGALGQALAKRWHGLRRARALARSWDVVYVQRQLLAPRALARLRQQGARLVFDFDDALYLDHEAAVAAMVRAADLVIVSTPALVPFCAAHRDAAQRPALVLPTPVEADRITPAARSPETFTVGWIGSPWTTPYLAPLAPVLADLARTGPLRLRLVGAEAARLPPLPGVAVEALPWTLDGEAEALRGMSVGVMPLPEGDAWAAGKGAYKLYQYMAAGLPVVASPVGLNADVVREGANGLLAATPEAWHAALARLRGDPALAARLGAEGRADACARYDRRVVFARLLAALRDLG